MACSKDKSGHAFIPTFVTANPIVAWTWCGELFAACTRRGKTPAMYQSITVDTKMVRFKKYQNTRFHDDIHVDPQPAGKLGHAYLKGLRANFTDIGTTSWPALAAAADHAAGAIEDGGKGYLFLFGHYPPFHTPGVLAHDPGVFTTFNPGDKKSPAPGMADYVVGNRVLLGAERACSTRRRPGATRTNPPCRPGRRVGLRLLQRPARRLRPA